MPVKIGDNLTLEDNKLSAVYKELYTKLNKAYAWTHTETTSSNATIAFIKPSVQDIYNILPLSSYDKFYISRGSDNGRWGTSSYYIIDGKLYKGLTPTQVGTDTDYKECQDSYAITTDGKLWYINNNGSRTQIGTDTWLCFSPTLCDADEIYGITTSGYLYLISYMNPTQVGNSNGWTYIYTEHTPFKGICNGYIYTVDRNNCTLVSSALNNCVKIINDDSYFTVLTSDNKLYSDDDLTTPKLTNVKDFFPAFGDGGYNYAITNDGKLYRNTGNSGNYRLIEGTMNWTCAIGHNSSQYAWGIADGKLYSFQTGTSPTTFTQIGTETTYKYLNGNMQLMLATLGEGTTISHTVYTTKHPLVGDNTYLNESLKIYSKIIESRGNIITDMYGSYVRDGLKDSHFIHIPGETMHETLSVIDILQATKPNN